MGNALASISCIKAQEGYRLEDVHILKGLDPVSQTVCPAHGTSISRALEHAWE
jgi:hypothetical protein